MTEKVRFHLDESVSNAIAYGLRRRGIDVTTTPELGLISASDDEQLAFALAQSRVLVTHNDDFVVLHRQGKPHAGIAYCGPQRRSLGDMIRILTLIWDVLAPAEMVNYIEFL
jgi:predicted nuclease of predicted toxin-antitoxin system